VWQKNFLKDYGAATPHWGHSAHPLVDEKNVGSSVVLMANNPVFFVLEGLFDNSPVIYRWDARR